MKAEERVKSSAGQATAKILVVEDEPNMVAGLRDNFEFEGYQVGCGSFRFFNSVGIRGNLAGVRAPTTLLSS
jgi:hypothetical protein